MNILEISHVSKRFGTHKVIDDLSFQVREHAIYGFIGQNGAGKTTTMKMILGLLKADKGKILVGGEPVEYGQNRTNKMIGYLPDVPEFYSYMKPEEYLNLCGEITGMTQKELKERIPELLELVGLHSYRKRIGGFSRGMKQRLGIAQALLNRPKLLICDEPTSALDPVGRKELLDILLSAKEQATVVFSTHILSDVEHICDEIGLLHEGKLALSGTLEEIQKMHGSRGIEIDFPEMKDVEAFQTVFPDAVRSGKTQLVCKENSMKEVMQVILDKGLHPGKIEMLEPTLESLFMEVVSK